MPQTPTPIEHAFVAGFHAGALADDDDVLPAELAKYMSASPPAHEVDEDDDSTALDQCQFCMGAKGGTPGKENIVQGARVCMFCTDLLIDITQAMLDNAVRAPAPDVLSGAAHDDAYAAAGALVRSGTATAHAHSELEATGQRYGLVTEHGGTVTDPLELAMYAKMKELNIAVCPTCYNTGWIAEGTVICDCPVGEFLDKKIARDREGA